MNRYLPFPLALMPLAFMPVQAAAQGTPAPKGPAPKGLAPKAAVPVPKPDVYLPLERTTYFCGEAIPLFAAEVGSLELVDERGAVVARGNSNLQQQIWRLDTASLAPGEYTLRISGKPEGSKVTLVGTQRPSPGIMFDERVPDAAAFRKDKDKILTALRESELDAVVAVGQDDGTRYQQLDDLARQRAMLWVNPYTRPNSFVPARVYQPEMQNMAQRNALIAAMNARYPNFGGLAHTWDPVGYDRSMLLFYWDWKGQENALRQYNKRSTDAFYDEFRRRTGMEPVTSADFLRYVGAIHEPESGPAFDLPTAVWSKEIAAKTPPLTPAEFAALEKRVDAWAKYTTSAVLGESNEYFQQWLKRVAPTMTGTASMDNEFAPKDGAWPPAAYTPLDFRWVEAWNDQVDAPDYAYGWLFHAALADIGSRPGQPVWVASLLNRAYNKAIYPGRFTRAIAHNLAYNGRGMGLAVEGFSTLLSNSYSPSLWWNMKGTAGEEDYLSGREWLRRFAPLQEQSTPVRKVGVLLSATQLGRRFTHLNFDKPYFNAFITLARLGYTPRLVTEEEIARGELKGYSSLVVVSQTANLPAPVLDHLKSFQAGGGKVLLSRDSSITIPGAQPLEVTEPRRRPGRPHNWLAPNSLHEPSPSVGLTRFKELAPAFLAAMGEELRTPLKAGSGSEAQVSTFGLDGGPDAAYVIATNDAFAGNPSTWVRQSVKLVPRAGAGQYQALYDLSDEKSLGALAPVNAEFQDRTARLYALLTRPVEKLDLRASQSIEAGSAVRVSVAFLDKANQPLRGALPFYLTWTSPAGKQENVFHRATGQTGTFTMDLPTGINAVPGKWTLSARSYLDGRSVSLPVQIRAARNPETVLRPVAEPVLARGDFAAFWKAAPSVVAPIFEGPLKDERLAAAKEAQRVLAAKGVKVEIVENPTVTTYTKAYDPTPEELAENARADKGETFGQIKRTTINRNDYFAARSGYVYTRPVLLLDSSQPKDNPMAEALDSAGMLWPKVSEEFPGAGRAVNQIVKSAFHLGQDSVIVQANDGAGLLAGVRALAQTPADWISPPIEKTRTILTRDLSIGRQPAEAVAVTASGPAKVTAEGAVVGRDARPLGLKFPQGLPPLPEETTPWTLPAPPVSAVPAVLEVPTAGRPFMRHGDAWIRAEIPSKGWTSDLRFNQAVAMRVQIPQQGNYRFNLKGTFRFSDRQPATQAPWEEIVELYMKVVQPKREPMSFEVLLDGKPLGTLTEAVTGEEEVVVKFGRGQQTKEKETVGTQVGGVLNLPAGEHDLLFVHRNIVDGMLKTVEIAAP